MNVIVFYVKYSMLNMLNTSVTPGDTFFTKLLKKIGGKR